MGHLEEFSKTDNRTERCTNLVAHISQESILHGLYLLRFSTFPCQLFFSSLDLADVTTSTKILLDATLIVQDWNKRHQNAKAHTFLDTDSGIEGCLLWL